MANTVLTEAQAQLGNISNGLVVPSAEVQPVITNFFASLNQLINMGIVQTDNVRKDVNDKFATLIKDVTNRLVATGNRIIARKRAVLEKIYAATMNALEVGNNRINLGLFKGGGIICKIMQRVKNIFTAVLGTLIPQLETCATKLTSLNMASAASAMTTMTTNTSAILKSLNDKLDLQYNTFSGNVNTTATGVTVKSAEITSGFLKRINDLDESVPNNSPAFDTCLLSAWELAEYVPLMIMDNLDACVHTAMAEANATDDAMDAQMKEMQASAASLVTNICNCVANITSSSNMVLRASASTCASNAAKLLTSDPVKAKADTMDGEYKKALTDTTAKYDVCIADITVQLPDLQAYVNSEIDLCKDEI